MKTLPCWPRTTATKARNCANRVVWCVFTGATRHALQNILWFTVLCIATFSGRADSSGSPEEDRNQSLHSQTFISKLLIPDATSVFREGHLTNISGGTYAGSQTCGQCHREAFAQWQQSHHGQAMAHPTPGTVKGEFSGPDLALGGQRIRFSQKDDQFAIRLDGADGELESFRVAYTFGTAPLQQYLTDMGDGRLQALPVVWDTREGGRGWYHLQEETIGQPDDVLHWTASGQNWNHMCADCHSTAVKKGFDEASNTFATQFAEVSVGCEACHGPGSAHSENPSQFSVVRLRDPKTRMDVCASCHSRRSQVAEGFTPESRLLDHYVPSLLDEGLYFADGQILDEVFVYGSFVQSKMHYAGVTCGDCHAPHSARLLREGNDVCTACHSPGGSSRFPGLQPKVYDSPEHHFHASNAAAGKFERVLGSGSACVDCHMTARVYMGIDDRRDHSFRLPRPDLSSALGVPNACNGCHEDRSSDWAAKQLATRFGAKSSDHFAYAVDAARRGKQSARSPLMKLVSNEQLPGIVRATGLSLLGRYAGQGQSQGQIQARIQPLRRGLQDADPLVRLGALRGLSATGAGNWQELMPLLTDPLRGLRFAALSALLPIYPRLPPSVRGMMDTATDEYLEYLTANADRAESLTSRALVHQARGDIKAAEADLQQALQRNPAWVPGLVNLADLYRATGRDVMAGGLLRQALALAPEDGQVRVAMALWQVRQGKLTQGIETLAAGHTQGLVQGLDSGSAYIYAVALNSAGKSEQAMAVVDDLLTADLQTSQLLRLGISLAQQHRSAERLRRYQVALQSL